MATWTSLVVLSLAVVSTLSFPRPGAEYKIPRVGDGARAQYYVLHSDGTYKYGYDSGDGLYEQSMAQVPGEVTGTFGYKDPTGADIKLEYTADNRGFIARGAHLPVAPVAELGSPASVAATRAAAAAYVGPSASPTSSAAAPSAPVEVAHIRSSTSNDGSYSFGYETSSSSRAESADAHNSVTGQYSFVADDGINRKISYIAGSGTGYIAEGDSLPVGPAVPGAESGIPTGRILPILSEEEANALAAATSGSSRITSYAGSRASTFPAASPSASTKSATPESSDASYSFSYDADDSARSESADANLNIKGSYSFVPAEGHRLTVNYIAGSDTGFVATGDHLPVAPEADFDSRVSGVAVSPAVYSASVPAIVSPSAAAAPVEVAQVRSSTNEDGSYSFGYETLSSSRSESADAQNSVTGHYSFIADDGVNREIRYIAGAETGYIADGDSLPIGPSVPGAESGIPTGRIFPILSEDEANALAAATSGSSSTYSAAASSASTSSAASSGAVASVNSVATGPSDASYSFRYDAGDSTRQETADADLNIVGSYSFVPPVGHRLTVNYIAGSDTGFVATGNHLPVASDAIGTPSAAVPYSGPFAASTSAIAAPAAPSAVSVPVEVAQVRSSSANDGSYSFGYETSSSSRAESADAHNSVTGQYSFVADDGINRKIKYIAGSGTGYIAEGDSLPVGPAVPGAESGIPTGRILPVFSEEEANAIAAAFSTGGSSPLLKSGAGSDVSATPADASYSFSFASDSYSRNEEADSDGNVVGSYTYVDEDGNEHTVKFVAGRETGFLPEGFPTPALASTTGAASASAPAAASTYSLTNQAVATRPTGASSAATYSSAQGISSSSGHSSQVVGDVLLHQYDAVNRDKYGYVFTALRR